MTTIEKNTESFYVTGGTLRRDAACYVQRKADQALYDGAMQGNFCYVLTSRQMGKSSLMVRTAARLREDGVHVAVLDLTSIGQNLNAEQWYDGLLSRLGQQFHLEDELEEFWLNHARLSPLLRWMKAIREVVLPRLAGRIVLFVDEIDAVRSLPFSTDEFFAAIRELYNRRTEDAELERLTFCLLGVASPSDLIRDTRTTPFNIGQRIELNDFTDDEAAPLSKGLGREEKTAAKLLKRILYWTGGHPYLTQRLCQAVAEDANINDAGSIDRLCEELFFTTRARERDDNLLFVRERMLKSEADRAALLDLYKKLRDDKRVKDDETNPLISVLRLSGITRVAEGLLYVRNRIYYRVFDREWVLANLPDAELLRQRAAYRRGLWRATAIAAVIVAAVGSLAFVAIRQRNQLRVQDQDKARLLYTSDMNLAGQDWENENAARMSELLTRHIPKPEETDPRGFEWFYLWQLGHQDQVTVPFSLSPAVFLLGTALFSPDAKAIASVERSSVKLWDSFTGKELLMLPGHKEEVTCLAFSPDGKKLVSGGQGGVAKTWNVLKGEELRTQTIEGGGVIISVAFSPDGKSFAAATFSGVIKLWDSETGTEIISLKIPPKSDQNGPQLINQIVFSPDGQKLISEGDDFFIRVWDIHNGKITLQINEGGYGNGVDISPDGKYLVTGTNFGSIRLWDAATGRLVKSLPGADSYRAVKFSPNGKRLVSAGSGAKLWDVDSGQEMLTLKGHASNVYMAAFSPDGNRLVTRSFDRTMKVWNLSDDLKPIVLKAHTEMVVSVAFSTDGKKFASVGFEPEQAKQTAIVWDAATRAPIRTIQSKEENALTPTERIGIKLWEVLTGRELPSLGEFKGSVSTISPDGNIVIIGGDNFGKVKLTDVVTKREIASFDACLHPVFSSDGKKLALSCVDMTDRTTNIRIIEAATGKLLQMLKTTAMTYTTEFSPDGTKLATVAIIGNNPDSKVKLWDLPIGREIMTFSGHGDSVGACAFSPDGKRLATASHDKTIKLWDTATGDDLLTLRGHDQMVTSVAFSPDGQTLASTSVDKTIRLWRAATAAEVQARQGQ